MPVFLLQTYCAFLPISNPLVLWRKGNKHLGQNPSHDNIIIPRVRPCTLCHKLGRLLFAREKTALRRGCNLGFMILMQYTLWPGPLLELVWRQAGHQRKWHGIVRVDHRAWATSARRGVGPRVMGPGVLCDLCRPAALSEADPARRRLPCCPVGRGGKGRGPSGH